MISPETARELFGSLFESASLWLSEFYQTETKKVRTWSLSNGEITSLCFSNNAIPKGGVSILQREDKNESTYRVGLNIYIQNPRVPDGSFAVLLSNQEEFGFIGGVIELFPAIRIGADIEMFRHKMQMVAQKHEQDYESCRKGLSGAFRLKGSDENLGAEAGFNFYRSGLEANFQNIVFAQEAFLKALDAYKSIAVKSGHTHGVENPHAKEPFWRKHLQYMQKEDVGIKMALEQGIPLEFFEFSAFPPVEE
ncbi:hypothetical protein ACFL43_02785 [Thermodesulfobacteriota bacterium]